MIKRQLPLQSSNRWFEKRRDFFVRQLIEDFFAVKQAFQDTYFVYLECRKPGTFDCSDLLDDHVVEQRRQLWDRLVRMIGTEGVKGPLWQLKDLCHMVWPGIGHDQDVRGSLFDWLVGSIFHETMKLKENIYLVDRYGPAACRIKARPLHAGSGTENGVLSRPVNRLENIIDVSGLIRRAVADAVGQMEQISFLFTHASYMLRIKMPAFAGNSLVIRLLVEQPRQVRQLWGEEIEDIFEDMFAGDTAEGFCAAGRSYMKAQWFPQALNMYRRALEVNPGHNEAVTRTLELRHFDGENKESVIA